MSDFSQEKTLRAHILLLEEGGEYANYFAKGESGMWKLIDPANKAAAQALLDAKVAEVDTHVGSAEPNGSGPSNFEDYTPIHFSDSVDGAKYRAWFVDSNGSYWKADNGNSDTLSEITDEQEITALLEESGFIPQ